METHKCCAVALCVVFCKLSDIYQYLLISCAIVEQYDHFFQCQGIVQQDEKEKGYQYIRIKSPDSDVFFILFHYALTLKEVVIQFAAMLSRLGEEWDITEDLIDDLEEFTCAIYG